ncbi:MAG: hypothetical protein AB7O28_17520 [Vicinamibacterales bacterium]
MTVASHAVVAALALAMPLAGAHQAHPDFSGTWTMDVAKSESPYQGASFEVPTVVITQTPSNVAIESRRRSGADTVRYAVTTGKTPVPGPTTPGRAYWDGPVLVTEGTRVVNGQTVSFRERRSLDAGGGEMTVVTTVIVQHGYSIRGAQNYGTATDVFRRTAQNLETR